MSSHSERSKRGLTERIAALFDESKASVPEIDGYANLTLIGSGGMGDVYQATQLGINRTVAIKVAKHLVSGDEIVQQRFLSEAQTLGKLRHSGIVQILQVGTTKLQGVDIPFLVMEFVGDGSLREKLQDGKLSEARSVSVVDQLCNALECIHAAGIVHRDIKPENILIGNDGHVWLADFGIAWELSSNRLTSNNQSPFTRGYASPEQYMGRKVDARADVYSCGVLLLELLTGERPDADKQSITALNPKWRAIIEKATADDRADRYQNIDDFRRAITGSGNALVDTVGNQTAEAAPAQPAKSDKRLLLIGGVVALLVISISIVASGVLGMGDNGSSSTDPGDAHHQANSPTLGQPNKPKMDSIAVYQNELDSGQWLVLANEQGTVSEKVLANGRKRLRISGLGALVTKNEAKFADGQHTIVGVSTGAVINETDSLWLGLRAGNVRQADNPAAHELESKRRIVEFQSKYQFRRIEGNTASEITFSGNAIPGGLGKPPQQFVLHRNGELFFGRQKDRRIAAKCLQKS